MLVWKKRSYFFGFVLKKNGDLWSENNLGQNIEAQQFLLFICLICFHLWITLWESLKVMIIMSENKRNTKKIMSIEPRRFCYLYLSTLLFRGSNENNNYMSRFPFVFRLNKFYFIWNFLSFSYLFIFFF